MDEFRLGALLLQNPMVAEADLDRCLEIQRLTGGQRPLGEILVEEGVLSERALEDLLALQARQRHSASLGAESLDPEPLVRAALAAGANDVFLSEGRQAMVRVAGELVPLAGESVTAAHIARFASWACGAEAGDLIARHISFSRDLALPDLVRGRLEAFRHLEGMCAAVRLHPLPPRDAAAALGGELLAGLHERKGLLLVAGEVRSGVSETLGALLAHLRRDRDKLILVLDDSLEFALGNGDAPVICRRVGVHTTDFSTGLRSSIDHDPDVLLVGDASSPQVFDLCLRFAEAGRLVIAGMRAGGVAAALQHVFGFYGRNDLPRVRATLAAILHGVVAVQLVPNTDRNGLALATEVLRVDDAVREVVREGLLSQLALLMRIDPQHCGHTMDDSLLALLQRGAITRGEAFARSDDRSRVLASSAKEAGDVRPH